MFEQWAETIVGANSAATIVQARSERSKSFSLTPLLGMDEDGGGLSPASLSYCSVFHSKSKVCIYALCP